jgi:hypothetical protein
MITKELLVNKIKKNFDERLLNFYRDFDSILKDKNVSKLYFKILEMDDLDFYTMFKKVLNVSVKGNNSLEFFESLHSFLINCFLDDGGVRIYRIRKPYILPEEYEIVLRMDYDKRATAGEVIEAIDLKDFKEGQRLRGYSELFKNYNPEDEEKKRLGRFPELMFKYGKNPEINYPILEEDNNE